MSYQRSLLIFGRTGQTGSRVQAIVPVFELFERFWLFEIGYTPFIQIMPELARLQHRPELQTIWLLIKRKKFQKKVHSRFVQGFVQGLFKAPSTLRTNYRPSSRLRLCDP